MYAVEWSFRLTGCVPACEIGLIGDGDAAGSRFSLFFDAHNAK